jgi:DNA polymerase
MGIRDDIAGDWHASLAALAWHVEIGVDEVISEAPVNRYDLPETTRAPAAVAPAPAPAAPAAPANPAPKPPAAQEA